MNEVPTPSYVGGILNLTGVRPGHAFQYEGDTMPSVMHFDVSFLSTHDAIDRLVVPPGLEVDRGIDPVVTISYFTNHLVRGMDGRNTPYQAVMLSALTTHGEYRGVAGFEYLDGLHGDKTEMDIMGPWGVYFGMLKKMADIRCVHRTANEIEVSVTRRGKRLITMGMTLGGEVDDAEIEAMNSATVGAFGVREIPTVDFSGYVERSIVWSAPSGPGRFRRAWHAHSGSVAFAGIDLDPLDELPVLGVVGARAYESVSPRETYAGRRVIESLPLEV